MATPLASPVYTITSWMGNVTDDFGVDWIVESEDGWSSSAPVRPTAEDKSAGDGSWSGPGFFGARIITLSGKAIANDRLTMLAAKDRLKAVVSPLTRTLTTLQVDEAHLSRVAKVRLSDQLTITDLGAQVFDWSMILTAPDPRRYASDAVSASASLPSATGAGRTYPRTYPLVYGGGGGGSGSVYLEQSGDYDETPALIRFTGPLISPSVMHVQSGRTLTFDITLADGETLDVDLGARSVLLNGTASRAFAITSGSAWFMLRPGLNELQFRGQDPGGGTTPLMTVTASSAWT